MKILLVVFLVLITGCSYAEGLKCESAHEFKELILDESYSDLARIIDFPVQALIGGSQVTISDEVMLKALSKSIFTEYFIASIKGIRDCELAARLNIGEDYKIASLIISQEENDLRYSKSGITSAKQLDKFIEDVNTYIATKNYSSLSELFKYPFYIAVNDQKVKVETREEFLEYQLSIINTSFLELIAKISKTRGFIPHVNGLMLNRRGDYWIVEVHGRLYLQAVEPFYR